jgi:hypothetical protein
MWVLAALCACALCGCGHKPSPPPLVGVWEATGSDKYAGASFEITDTSIIFRRAPDYVDRNHILRIEATPADDKVNYDIQYRTFAGGNVTLALSYISAKEGPVIRFKYQPSVVWRPVPPAPHNP